MKPLSENDYNLNEGENIKEFNKYYSVNNAKASNRPLASP